MSLFGSKYQRDKEFDEMEELANQQEEPTVHEHVTVIADETHFEGTISGNGTVLIMGDMNGKIDMVGDLKVFNGGCMTGPITADNIVVAGKVIGDIKAYDKLIIAQTGDVQGTVITNSLTIDNGGKFNGKSIMHEKIDRRSDICLDKVSRADIIDDATSEADEESKKVAMDGEENSDDFDKIESETDKEVVNHN